MKKQREARYGLLTVLLLSMLLLFIWTGFEAEAFLIDDNRVQWYPVMERAYEDVLSGKIYSYDFYQMKGMSIAEQGYYGVMNPFMLISYCIAHYTPFNLSTITIYIMLMFLMGNCFFYLLCRQIGCSGRLSVLMTLSYSTAGCFAAFYYWYYVYNNYFIIPLLLYVFLMFEGRKEGYFVCGIVLALDLYLGNAQYTCFHYMLFCILCMGMALLKKARYLLVMCTNILTGALLSLPVFALLMGAADAFGKNEGFFDYPIYLPSLLVHFAIPHGLLHRMGLSVPLLGTNVMSRRDNLVLYLGAPCLVLLIMMIMGTYRQICRIASETAAMKAKEVFRYGIAGLRAAYAKAACMSGIEQMILGCILALLCFLSFMGEGIVAAVLSRMPVIQNFRYLFKAIFIIAPLVNVIAAFMIMRSNGRRRKAVIVIMLLGICVGTGNAYYTIRETGSLFDMRIDSGYEEEVAYTVEMLADQGVDYKNYRTVTFMKYPGVNDECFDCSMNLTKNYPTGIGAFSLAGYEIATSDKRLKEFDAIYSDSGIFFVYANADGTENFYRSLIEQPERVQRQLIDNGVRYLLVERSDSEPNQTLLRRQVSRQVKMSGQDYERLIIAALDEMPTLAVERVEQLNANYDLIVLSGVNSLCVTEQGECVPVKDENMQMITFEAAGPGVYRLAFSYDSHLRAYLENKDGIKEPIAVTKADNGTILVDTKDMFGKVYLTYDNKICTAGFVWEGATGILFLMILLLCLRHKIGT